MGAAVLLDLCVFSGMRLSFRLSAPLGLQKRRLVLEQNVQKIQSSRTWLCVLQWLMSVDGKGLVFSRNLHS